MTAPSQASHAVARGLAYLAHRQLPDGRLPDTGTSITAHAILLEALEGLPEPDAGPLRKKLAEWLQAALPASQHQLHATFTALNALHGYYGDALPGSVLGSATKLLVTAELRVGGPYAHRLPKPPLGVPDIATNAAIAQFVQAVAHPLPNLTALLGQAIRQGQWQSLPYRSSYATAWQITKAYNGVQQPALRQYLQAAAQRADLTAFDAAFLAAALTSLQAGGTDHLRQLILAAQQPDGSWPARPVLAGESPDGSAALSTALALLGLQAAATAPVKASVTTISPSRRHEEAARAVYHRADQLIATFSPDLRHACREMLHRIQVADTDYEITALPLLAAESLLRPTALPEELLVELGLANLCNWGAFTLYDDFYDGEGQARLLPAANAQLHHALTQFTAALPDRPAFQQLVHERFDALDSANAWEIAHCRMTIEDGTVTIGLLPDFGDRSPLAARSFTHLLPLFGVLASAGYDLAAPQVAALEQAGRHYLISRQLSDDMHDWEEDLRAGTISYVLVQAFAGLGLKPGRYSLEELVSRTQKQFWNHTLTSICTDLEAHIAAGRQASIQSGLLIEASFFAHFFDKLEQVLLRTRREHRKTLHFIQAYRRTPPV